VLKKSLFAVLVWLAAAPLCAAVPDDDPRVTPVVRAYRRARPAMVNISTQTLVEVAVGGRFRDPLAELFPDPLRRRVPVQSLGSGVVIHPAGYIVTNAHVVRRAQKITASTAEGHELEARVISVDAETDLAILKVDPPDGEPLAFLPLGRSDDLMVGETVIAVGNALGFTDSVTTGVISAIGRKLDLGGRIGGLIQTDAPINPGNSGGALLNIKGEFIGINTAIRADAQNIGFAIPVDLLTAEMPRLLDFERINRVVFGAVVEGRCGNAGPEAVVAEVKPETPAAKVLKKGDRILAVGDAPVAGVVDFSCAMLQAKADGILSLRIGRDGKQRQVRLTLAARPKPDGRALAARLLGLHLREFDEELARELRLPVSEGLLVVEAEANRPAGQIGLEARDVLFQVGRFYVKDLDTLGMILEDVRPGDTLRIGIMRGRTRAWAPIKASEPTEAASEKPDR
jgi:serine protease Do